MNYPEFQIPASVNYLAEVISELPHNCMYDKVLTGAGGTYIAIHDKNNYIICVPYVSLIENKCFQHDHIFGVYEGTKISDLKEYLDNDLIPVKKIMVTYDSIEKVLKYIDPNEYKLLVDELHCLFQNYLFRNEAVMKVLNNYEKFKSYCFMTATMIEPEFTLEELKHLPTYTANWEVIKEVKVHSVKCDTNVTHTVAFLIDSFLNGEKKGNAHIFINSVDTIKELVRHCNLNDDNCRAIWSKNNKTLMTITRGHINDEVKKINMYTSCSFEGTDIMDTEGRVYIVSDSTKSHSMLDIATSFKQIAGRLRKTKYWRTITHIFTTTRYNNFISYNEYKKFAEDEIALCKKKVNSLNNLDIDTKKDVLKWFKKEFKEGLSSYLTFKDEDFKYEENFYKLDLYHYKITNHLYAFRVNLCKEYKKINMTYQDWDTDKTQLDNKHIVKVSPKKNFMETMQEYEKGDSDFILWANRKYSFLSEAVQKLGFKKIKELKYNVSNIKKALISSRSRSPEGKVKDELMLNNKIKKGSFITIEEVKKILTDVYKTHNIDQKVKSTDIEKYILVKKTTKKVYDKLENGYVILNFK